MDVVVLSNVLEHSPAPNQMLLDVGRLLKSGGQVWDKLPELSQLAPQGVRLILDQLAPRSVSYLAFFSRQIAEAADSKLVLLLSKQRKSLRHCGCRPQSSPGSSQKKDGPRENSETPFSCSAYPRSPGYSCFLPCGSGIAVVEGLSFGAGGQILMVDNGLRTGHLHVLCLCFKGWAVFSHFRLSHQKGDLRRRHSSSRCHRTRRRLPCGIFAGHVDTTSMESKRRASSFNTARVDHLYQDPYDGNRRFSLHYGDMTDANKPDSRDLS